MPTLGYATSAPTPTQALHYCQKPLELNFNMNMKNHPEFVHSENTDLAEWAETIILNFHLVK